MKNKMNNKNYWLSINETVFIWKKKRECLFYCSEKYIYFFYLIENDRMEEIINQLIHTDNLYCIALTEEDRSNPKIYKFIKTILDQTLGKIYERKLNTPYRPIQLPPILNLQCEVERLGDQNIIDKNIGDEILSNLHELVISLPDSFTKDYSENLCKLLDSIQYSLLNKITIKNAIVECPLQLINKWKEMNRKIIFEYKLDQIPLLNQSLILANKISEVKVLVSSNFDCNEIGETNKIFSNIHYQFHIDSEDNYNRVCNYCKVNEIVNYSIVPCFTGDNYAFFEKNIYLTKEDIHSSQLTKKNIFANQVVNSNFFGKIYIEPNGKVLDHPKSELEYDLTDDIRDVVYYALNDGKYWRKTRKEVIPCENCVYQWICPSPSDYELEINKINLCHLK